MEGIQEWFAPLLWILGTITSLVLFIRLCKPIWSFLQMPKQLNESITKLDEKITENFKGMERRLDKLEYDIEQLRAFDSLAEEVQVNLLRDRLSQGYHYYSERGSISSDAYRSLCDIYEVYKKCNANSYATSIMDKLRELYNKSHPVGTPRN
jgi:hypothetical protein